MLNRLKEHLDNNLPFLKGKKLLLAISGGIDSMVLIHLFKKLGYSIAIAHCNFNLRGEESNGDEQFIKEYAKFENINIFVNNFNTKTYSVQNKVSIQIAARELRYNWFEKLAEANGFDYLLTAHHLDDCAETFLINFTRGTGLEGLLGIPVQNGIIVRPLLPFTRDDIEKFAAINEIKWREDSSNASDKYFRNKIRHHIIPLLKELNPSFAESFASTLSNLQQSHSLAEDAAVWLYTKAVSQNGDTKAIDLEVLNTHYNYKSYLYKWLVPYGFTAWDDIFDLVNAQSGKVILSEGYRLIKDRTVLLLQPIKNRDEEVYEIAENVEKTTKPIGLKLQKTAKKDETSSKNAIFVNNELIKFPLFVRKWKEGDYFYPTGMNGKKKKVSKYFKDEKFSLVDKESTWLLCSEDEIVWIIGHRADERFKTKTQTTRILKIEVI